MIQIRIHGRGGQGVVTAAELIAISAFKAGHYSQAFPSFGVERSGSPLVAFARISDEQILAREQIYEPEVIIIQDATLLESIDVLGGANKNTKIIINSSEPELIFKILKTNKIQSFRPQEKQVFIINASGEALKIFGKNLVNTAILGALAKITGTISLEALQEAISEKFASKGPEVIKKNIALAIKLYEEN
jgi:2-oxoacid:acceptor oxidoreductase gamma subunit (pyruvate/2-ketoisovalerate family)